MDIEKREAFVIRQVLLLLISFLLVWIVSSFGHKDALEFTYTTSRSFEKFLLASLAIYGCGNIISVCVRKSVGDRAQFLLPTIFVGLLIFYGWKTLLHNEDVYIASGVAGILLLIVAYVCRVKNLEAVIEKMNRGDEKWYRLILFVGIGVWLAFVVGNTVARYLSYVAPTYDMGIFTQMFYYMKKNLTAVTTCERSKILSHFQVHVSPALYIFLPIYAIFPSPVTLVVCQAFVVISGIIPMCKLMNGHGFSPMTKAFFGLAVIFYPCLAGGCFYDFHENKMLFAAILWLLYLMEKKKKLFFWGLVVFTLMIKEDAAIYVACLGLFMMFNRKEYKKGSLVVVVSMLVFAGDVYFLNHYGDGAMTERYANYLDQGENSFVYMIINLLKNPVYVFSQMFTETKAQFLLWMLIPTLGLPFVTKRCSDYILLLPMILMNLMGANEYQSSIYYQYTYATAAFLFYLTVLHLEPMEKVKRVKMTCFMALASILLFASALSLKSKYLPQYFENKEMYQEMDVDLARIPKDASVRATTYLVPKLAQRDVIYAYNFSEDLTDYICYDLIYGSSMEYYNNDVQKLKSIGYEEILHSNHLVILKRADVK